MAMTFTQTDADGGQCTSVTERLAQSGASAGSTPVSVSVPGSATAFLIYFILDIPAGTSEDAGDWTHRLNVTTANMNLSVTAVRVGYINDEPTCSALVASGSDTTGFGLDTTGVKSSTFSATAMAGDRPVAIRYVVANSSMSSQSFSFTPDQNIDSPFTASSNVSITSGLGQLTLTGRTPTVFTLDPKAVTTGLGQLAITGHVPTLAVSDNVNVSAGLGALTLTGHSPTPVATANVFITAGVGALTITGYEPTVSKHITTALGQLTLTGHAPTVFASTNVLVSAALGELSLTGHAPTLAKSENTFITPDVGALTLTGLQPTAQATANVFISPNAGTLAITGHVPTIQSGASVTANPDVGLLTLTGLQPTVQTTAHVSVNTQTGALVITGYQPGVSTDASVAINTALGQLMLSGHIPSVDVTGQVIPVETPTPAGRSRRRKERIIARFKGQEYLFDSPYELQAFVESVRTKKRKPAVKVIVPQAVEEELANFDLPSLQIDLSRLNWKGALKTWEKYESLRKSQPVDFGQVRQHEAYLFRKLLEMEDEELLLL